MSVEFARSSTLSAEAEYGTALIHHQEPKQAHVVENNEGQPNPDSNASRRRTLAHKRADEVSNGDKDCTEQDRPHYHQGERRQAACIGVRSGGGEHQCGNAVSEDRRKSQNG